MKLCYCDESGNGSEPIAVMAGIFVDAKRMSPTKQEWRDLLSELSDVAGKRITEFHTREFYSGNHTWHGVTGPKRAEIAMRIAKWRSDRRHDIVYSAVVKKQYDERKRAGEMKDELNTHWRYLGFHLVLAIQKYSQCISGKKGHTIFVFDNEYKQELRFTDLLLRPPSWSDGYYGRGAKQDALDQLVDVPYFGDSRDVGLIQVADFVAYFLRRYAEIKEGCGKAPYPDEDSRVSAVVNCLMERSIGRSFMYPKTGRDESAELFYGLSPESIRNLG